MKYYFVYETTNNINGKKYIGQHTTSNIDDGYLGSGKILKQAINKYGKDNFSRKILAYASTKEELNELEKYYIDKYNAIESNEYYNIAEGGQGGNLIAGLSEKQLQERARKLSEARIGMKLTEEWKSNISKALKGNNNPMYERRGINSPHFGKHLTEETKNKISQSNKGHIVTEKTRIKISKARKGKYVGEDSPMYGKHHTEETRRRMSQAKYKPVIMLSKENKPLACFNCVLDANEYIGKPRNYVSSIYDCVKGITKSAYQHKWAYITITEL